jgi:hypothetical protein
MSVSQKTSNIDSYRLMVYNRALHPELFDVKERKIFRHGDYEAEAWLTPSGHAVRFQADGQCLTETVIESGDHLPENGLVHALPCLGEKDFEMSPAGGLCYVTTVQTESLIDNLFIATLNELQDFAAESDAIVLSWKDDDGGQCLSMLDSQKYRKEFHIQSYHLFGGQGMVLRSQSIFEML